MYGVPLVLEVLVHGDDVRVAERAGDTRLAQEALGEGRGRWRGTLSSSFSATRRSRSTWRAR